MFWIHQKLFMASKLGIFFHKIFTYEPMYLLHNSGLCCKIP